MSTFKQATCGIAAMAAALCVTASAQATTINLTPLSPGTITGSVAYTKNELLKFVFTIKPKFTFSFTETGDGGTFLFPISETVTGGSGLATVTFGKFPVMGTVDYSLTTSVPESATWVLMLAGFGLIGVSARRRSRMVAA